MHGDTTTTRRALIILARAPVPGRAKTRLIPLLGADGAASLQARLIALTLRRAAQVTEATVALWLDDEVTEGTPPAAEAGIAVHRQRGADLGERMHHALCEALAGADRAVLIGTDCPAMTSADLRAAFTALDAHELVLQPAEDGGYVAIGLRAPQPTLFRGIDWGSGQVLEQTLARAAAAKLTTALLPTLPDLDTPADYRRACDAGWL